MDEQIILAIIFSILGFISIIIIICFLIWLIRRRRRKSKSIKHNKKFSISQRQQYLRSQILPPTNMIHNQRKKRKRRFNTNDSVISFSFNPPHLINQNVKNLDQLIANESSLHYEQQSPTNNSDRFYINPSTEPVYTSSSSTSTPISNIPLAFQSYPHGQQLNNVHFQFLNELNHVLYSQQGQQLVNPVKYSQSCRQTNDLLPFDYYRSVTPSINSSHANFFEPIYNRTTSCSDVTLMRKARLAQFRDDTAILY